MLTVMKYNVLQRSLIGNNVRSAKKRTGRIGRRIGQSFIKTERDGLICEKACPV